MKIRGIIKIVALTAASLVFVIPNLVYMFPFLVGADSSYTVMSGSMRPELLPGDLIIVSDMEPSAINVDDMITIRNEDFIFTHRVIEKLEDGLFRLKGDANEEPDMNLVDASQIIGVVTIVFPFGHLYTSYGFALALLAPAGLLIGGQMHKIYQFTKRRNKKETMRWRRNNRSKSMIGTSTLLLTLILAVSTTRIVAPHLISGSGSYFSDVEWATGLFRAETWITARWYKQEALVELESIDGEFGKCKGIKSLTLEYSGGAGADVTVDKGTITDNGDGAYTISPENGKEKLDANTKIYVDGELNTEIHTSCSQPLNVGDIYGDFTVTDIDKISKNEVIEHIQKSLEVGLWIDENHLGSQHGHKVFDEEKKAVKKLMDIIDDPDTSQSVKNVCQSVINKLIEADKMLANTAYEEIKDYSGTVPKVHEEIGKCEEELNKAKNELDQKKYDKAIDHYKKAWKHAQEALKHAS